LADAQEYVAQIKEILKKVGAPSKTQIEEPIEQVPKVVKRRGRKPKAKIVEPKIQKKRGRKPKAVIAEPKVPKKRGRPFKVAPVATSENAPVMASTEPKEEVENQVLHQLYPQSNPRNEGDLSKLKQLYPHMNPRNLKKEAENQDFSTHK